MAPDNDLLNPYGFLQWLQNTHPELYVKCSNFFEGLDDRSGLDALRVCVDHETFQYIVDARFEYYHGRPKD